MQLPGTTTEDVTADSNDQAEIYQVFEVLRILDLIREDPHPNPIPEPGSPPWWTTALSGESD